MIGKDLLFTVVLLACLGFAGGCWFLDRRLERLRRQFKAQSRKLEEALQRLRSAEQAAAAEAEKPQPAPLATSSSASFDADLSQAQMCQRLKGGEGGGSVPEKYRLVAAMARRGLRAEDISQILGISAGETEQLLKLSMVAGKPEKSPGENKD